MEDEQEEMDLAFGETPDTQISNDNTPELLKALITNDAIPEKIRLKHWEIFNNDITLSFQDEASKKEKLIDFDLLKLDALMSTPYCEYSFENEEFWNKLKLVFENKLDRAKGFKTGGRVNERIIQQSQFGEQKVTKSIDSSQNSGNILSNLLGRRR